MHSVRHVVKQLAGVLTLTLCLSLLASLVATTTSPIGLRKLDLAFPLADPAPTYRIPISSPESITRSLTIRVEPGFMEFDFVVDLPRDHAEFRPLTSPLATEQLQQMVEDLFGQETQFGDNLPASTDRRQ